MTLEEKNAFVADWNAMVATVARFGDKYKLPKGELIFPPIVLDDLRDVAQENILGTLINHGVRVRFGTFEQAETFRQYP
jgi:hypothetical protein